MWPVSGSRYSSVCICRPDVLSLSLTWAWSMPLSLILPNEISMMSHAWQLSPRGCRSQSSNGNTFNLGHPVCFHLRSCNPSIYPTYRRVERASDSTWRISFSSSSSQPSRPTLSPAMGTHFSRFYHRHPRLSQLALSLFALFLISSLQHPDPTSPSFQLPGLFPSHYPPSRHLSNPALNTRLTTAAANLSQACQSPIEPIHIDPGLTPAQERRYEHLRRGQGRVMVVTTIREIASQMPDFLNALIVLVTYLGPSRLSFSILEGPSDDCTAQALENVLKPTLLEMGVPERHLHLTTRESKIDFSKHNRIEVLAGLRNRALSPLWTSTSKGKGKADDAVEAVVFVNDVYLRASDVLEVLHQHKRAGAGITTAWDWMERKPEYYYDVWVGRTVRAILVNVQG